MSNTNLSQRLVNFKHKFSQLLGPKRAGYNEVGLDQPLVASHAQSDDDYFQEHGVPRPGSMGRPTGQAQYQGQYSAGAGAASIPYNTSASIPDEVCAEGRTQECLRLPGCLGLGCVGWCENESIAMG